MPGVLYWGAELPDEACADLAATAAAAILHSAMDTPYFVTIAAGGADGWSGTPAFEWHAGGRVPSALSLDSVTTGESSVTFELSESRTSGAVSVTYHVHDSGVVEVTAELHNAGHEVLDVTALRMIMPLPGAATEILDTTGYWSGERKPQRLAVHNGTWDRTNRRGRTGHDGVTLTWVGSRGFGFRSGRVWSAHLAWSGNGQVFVERLSEGAAGNAAVVGAAELLAPGEIRLEPDERYVTPSVYFTFSASGIDGVTNRLHRLVRSFASYPRAPRPLVLNSWEAVYFDHDLPRLAALAKTAAEVGVERFVLDDGWFLGRRTDEAGLGDWYVDRSVWPDGLQPLSNRVHDLGMQFGLWFEPEMINPDSELARSHPEWILADDAGAQRHWRNQQVLNLADPEAWQHIFDRIDHVVTEAEVDFIKWDHNRDLHEAVDRRTGRSGVHAQTQAVYRMMDALTNKHPCLEIESCASGGARIDLGIAHHTQRVWASDSIDPLERQTIQLWTATLVPPELVGTHVGADRAHTTGRTTSLPFRLATSLMGHAGIEWDLTGRTEAELKAIAAWSELYRELRELIRTGDVVHADDVPEESLLYGIVSPNRDRAVFEWVQLGSGIVAATPRIAFPGLDVTRTYLVRFREEFGQAARRSRVDPPWVTRAAHGDPVAMSGAVLNGPGVPLPSLQPGEALVIDIREGHGEPTVSMLPA